MEFIWHIIIMICVWLPGSLSYTLVFGRGKILHFGPVALSLAATYGTFLTIAATESYALGILVGVLIAIFMSLLFAALSFRLDMESFGIVSIAMHLMVLAIILNWNALTRGALGLPNIDRAPLPNDLGSLAFVLFLIAAACVACMWALSRSSFGRALTALAEQEHVAGALGVSRKRIYTLTFLCAGLINIIGAILSTQYFGLLHPNDFLFSSVIFYIMLVVAGKPGSILGVTLSTILLVSLREGIRFIQVPQWTDIGWILAPIPSAVLGPSRLILFGVILFVAVWVRRDTLFPQKRII